MFEISLIDRIYSEDEYLTLDDSIEERCEFIDGRVFVLPFEGRVHASLKGQTLTGLSVRLEGAPCHVGGSRMRVLIEDQAYLYPDIVIWRDDAHFSGMEERNLHNPSVVFEVFSDFTGSRDHTVKLELYRRIPDLSDYLIVSSTHVHVEHYRRGQNGNEWEQFTYDSRDQIIRLGFMDVEMPVNEIYRRVDWPEQMPMS